MAYPLVPCPVRPGPVRPSLKCASAVELLGRPARLTTSLARVRRSSALMPAAAAALARLDQPGPGAGPTGAAGSGRVAGRTADFVPRIGLDELKALPVADRAGIVAGRTDRIGAVMDAYRDPWSLGREPPTGGRFAWALRLAPRGPRVQVYPVDVQDGHVVVRPR